MVHRLLFVATWLPSGAAVGAAVWAIERRRPYFDGGIVAAAAAVVRGRGTAGQAIAARFAATAADAAAGRIRTMIRRCFGH